MEIGKHTYFSTKNYKEIKARLKRPITIPFQLISPTPSTICLAQLRMYSDGS